MPTTTTTSKLPACADAVTEQGLRRLAAAVLVTKEGRRWNATAANQRVTQLLKWAEATAAPTYGELFGSAPVDAIKAWTTGEGPRGEGSVAAITETVARVLKLLAPDSDQLPLLQQLKAHADARSAERSRASAANAPPYADFLTADATARFVQELTDTGARCANLNEAVFCLLEIAVAACRGKALREARVFSADAFDTEVIHSCPAHGAGVAPVSIVLGAEGPRELVMGWWPASYPKATKSGRFARVDLGVPLLPEAARLLPAARAGLAQLCKGLTDGAHVFRNRTGAKIGRDTLSHAFRTLYGHPICDDKKGASGGLRKAVEGRARQLYEAGNIDEAACLLVHHRLQHDPAVALAKYTAPPLPDVESDVELDDDDSDQSPQGGRLVRQRAVSNDADLELHADDGDGGGGAEGVGAEGGGGGGAGGAAGGAAADADIADTIERLLDAGSTAKACIALFRHKRAHPSEDVELLEEALHAAKRARDA